MSVILDALKRVQDENRRCGATPAVPEPVPMHGSNALLRRLSAPEAPRLTARRQPGRAVWIGALAAAGIAVVATVLWWTQPSFSGSQANDGRALLTDLTANPRAAVRFPPPNPLPNPPPNPPPGSALAPSGVGLDPGALMATSEPLPLAAANGELNDLSANLPETAAVPTMTADSGEREPEPEPSFSLRVENRAASPSSRREAPERTVGSTDGAVAAGRARSVPLADRRSTLLDPGVRDAFAAGVRAQKEGSLARAEEAYKRALRHDPNNAKVNANLGVLYETEGRLEEAERHLRQASSVEPNNASVHNNLGVVLYRMGNYDSALIEFNRTLSLDPERLDAYTNKGLIFTRWGRYEDAERAFMQVLALNPDDSLANYNLGLVYEEVDDVGRAVDHYYRFLAAGAGDHPKIARDLAQHLSWLEGRLNGGAQRR